MNGDKLSLDELVRHNSNGNIQWLEDLIKSGITRVDIIVYRGKQRGIGRSELHRIKRSIPIRTYRDENGFYRWRMETQDEMLRGLRQYRTEMKRKADKKKSKLKSMR